MITYTVFKVFLVHDEKNIMVFSNHMYKIYIMYRSEKYLALSNTGKEILGDERARDERRASGFSGCCF